jgi:uncharacterized protein with GYD domain
MTQNTEFTRFVALVDVNDANVQNIQEMAAVWGEIRREFEEIGAVVEDAYAVLGEFDFVVVFEGADTETAFKTDVILERHGLDVQTMPVTDTDAFAELVKDV